MAVDGWALVNMAPSLIKSSGSSDFIVHLRPHSASTNIKAKLSSMVVFYSLI